METKNNLDLWNKVEKTNPKYTKRANVKGNNITSIAPQYQILNATEQFGVYGITWGFKNMEMNYTLSNIGLVSFKAIFYFPNGEFEIINSVALYRDNAMTKIDDNFAKKLETDTLTKALSKLGFNADIFLGKFDDQRYLNEVAKEFNEVNKQISIPAPKRLTPAQVKVIPKAEDLYKLQLVLKTYTLQPNEKEMIEKRISELTK